MTPEELNALLSPVLKKWMDTNGVTPTDAYYTARLASWQLIDTLDQYMLSYVQQHIEPGAEIIEIGAGYGQLSVLLSVCGGYKTTPIDTAESRHTGNQILVEHVKRVLDACPCTPVKGAYPAILPMLPKAQLVIATNIIGAWWGTLNSTESTRWAAFLDPCQAGILLDVARTGAYRPTGTAESHQAHEAITAAGWEITRLQVPNAKMGYDICFLHRK
jgi:hypothetical protein